MRKTIIMLAFAAAVLSGCSKPIETTKNEAARKYFESWVKINHPDAKPTTLGSYIIHEDKGTGKAAGTVEQNPYVRIDYTMRQLNGTVYATTSEKLSQQIGTYEENGTYGPAIFLRGEGHLAVGLEELLKSMNEGGKIEAAVPGWLSGMKTYSNPKDYLKEVTGTDYVYAIELKEAISDIKKWEIDSLVRFLAVEYPSVNPADTVKAAGNHKKYGFYYIQEKATDCPDSTFTDGTKVYLNYTGRLLNGRIFDTTDERTAKDAGIYSSGRSYKPTYVNWNQEYDKITMGAGSSDVIDGFKFALSGMKPHEKGTAIFFSEYGYSTNGSGSTIPAYSPLIFEFELVDGE